MEEVENESEKSAKMQAVRRGRVADSTRTERAARGWLRTAAEREVFKEGQRCEKSGGRADTNGNGGEKRKEGREGREERERRARDETE